VVLHFVAAYCDLTSICSSVACPNTNSFMVLVTVRSPVHTHKQRPIHDSFLAVLQTASYLGLLSSEFLTFSTHDKIELRTLM
jgi:hypothetical protein